MRCSSYFEKFAEELNDISESLESRKPSGIREMVSEHPVATALGGAGLGAGAILAKRFFPAAPIGPIAAKLRRAAEKGGLHFVAQGVEGIKKGKGGVEKILRAPKGLTSIGTEMVPITERGEFPAKFKTKGVMVGGIVDPRKVRSGGELYAGGQPLHTREGKRIMRAMQRLEEGGKAMEVRGLGLKKLFPETKTIEQINRKYRLKIPSIDASMSEKQKYFNELRSAMETEFGPSGFLVKPHGVAQSTGVFLGEGKKDWGKLYEKYTRKLKPRMEKMLADIKANPKAWDLGGEDPRSMVVREFRDYPKYVGSHLDEILKDPRRTIAQKKMELVSRGESIAAPEYRVHMIGGEVPEELAYDRYWVPGSVMSRIPGVGKLMGKTRFGSPQDAARWVREEVLPRMKGQYRKGTFGLDVMRVKNPDGTYGYKLVELNPASLTGGGSGFLDPDFSSFAPIDVYKYIYGREHPVEAATKALAAGGLGAGGGLLASRMAKQKSPEAK